MNDRFLEETRKWGSTKEYQFILKDVKYLFVDDFGTESSTERSGMDYFEFIDNRLEGDLVTIFSTNLSDEDILKNYGDRIYSRLHYAEGISFEGKPDRRMFKEKSPKITEIKHKLQ